MAMAGRSTRCGLSKARIWIGRSRASTRRTPFPVATPASERLSLRQLLRRFIDVCNVVAYAHSRGVLHRDLKPANILLGPYGETLVVDWGMAKLMDGTLTPAEVNEPAPGRPVEDTWDKTQQGTILGTIPYMSPEQAGGEAPAKVSDVYSLGATLYHLLTGRPPIEKDERSAMLHRARIGEIVPPRQVNARVPAALEAVCRKAMSVDPRDRYPSPRALADEIEHWLADEPVAAWKEPWLVRSRRWVSRHRTPVAAVTAGVAVAVLSLVHLLNDYHLRSVERKAHAEGLVVALSTAEVERSRRGRPPASAAPLAGARKAQVDGPAGLGATGKQTQERCAGPARRRPVRTQNTWLTGSCGTIFTLTRSAWSGKPCSNMTGRAFSAPRLWRLVAERAESTAPNLGAAGTLASFAPNDPRWVELAGPIAAELVTKSPSLIGEWREVFQPVQRTLVGPLRAIFGDIARPKERALAFGLLFDFAVHAGNAERDHDLAELIGDANPDEFLAIRRALADRGQAVAILQGKLDRKEQFNETTARRRGRMAACLIVLQSPERAWNLLRNAPPQDPTERTELIHDLAAYGAPASVVADRLLVETDASAHRALILALGEYSPAAVSDPVRRTVTERLLQRYATDGDPGTHSAIDWLFRTRWQLQAAARLARRVVAREGRLGRPKLVRQ